MFVLTWAGWGKVLGGPITDMAGTENFMIRLIDNSMSPGLKILNYPKELIQEYEFEYEHERKLIK
jgi:hypothetical protein